MFFLFVFVFEIGFFCLQPGYELNPKFASVGHQVWLFLQICRESKSMNLYGVLTSLLLNWKILCGFIYHPRNQKGRRG